MIFNHAVGVWFTHDESDVVRSKYYKKFAYQWFHIDGKCGMNFVWVKSKPDLIKLISNWNTTDAWKYLINCEV